MNIRAVIRAAAAKGIISESQIPKIIMLRVDRNRIPEFLIDNEIIETAKNLESELKTRLFLHFFYAFYCHHMDLFEKIINERNL